MRIKIAATKESKKISTFEKSEWPIADREHYGKLVDLTKKRYTFITQNNDGEISGILHLMVEANLAFIEDLLVGSTFRRMGIGTQLLAFAEKFAQDKKCTKIWLETNEGWAAEKLYRRAGYEVTGMHERHILNQRTLIFTKFLT